jgi:hypothetical protein
MDDERAVHDRAPSRAADLSADGVEVVRGDMLDAEAVSAAAPRGACGDRVRAHVVATARTACGSGLRRRRGRRRGEHRGRLPRELFPVVLHEPEELTQLGGVRERFPYWGRDDGFCSQSSWGPRKEMLGGKLSCWPGTRVRPGAWWVSISSTMRSSIRASGAPRQ